MNRRPMTKGVPAVRQKKQRRKRGIAPTGGMVPLSSKELKQHARLLAQGKPLSGRSGPFVYYMRNGRLCWRRYVVPEDPSTARQRRSRAAFRAASRTWSQGGPLTDKQRDAWYADGAKRQSRSRLAQSGPLTGQQNYIGRNSTRKQRDYQLLSRPPQRGQEKANPKRLKSELSVQVPKSQPITRSTSGPRWVHAVPAPSMRRGASGNAKKSKARQLISQMPHLQRSARSTSGRPQTSTRALPGPRQRKASQPKGTGQRDALKHPPKLGKARRNANRLKRSSV
ncbi:MAG: hypothetical protein WCK27_11685 [Verrucomicrobiota bacterium]